MLIYGFSDQISKSVYQTAKTNGATVIHTVAAGKILYLKEASCGGVNAAAPSAQALEVYNASDVLQYTILTVIAHTQGNTATKSFSGLIIPSGYSIKYRNFVAGVDVTFCEISGFEV